MSGRHIPFTSGGKARVDIDHALGELAELDRRAARTARYWSKAGKKFIGAGIKMRAADRGNRALRRPAPRADRLCPVGALRQQPQLFGFASDNATPNLAALWR